MQYKLITSLLGIQGFEVVHIEQSRLKPYKEFAMIVERHMDGSVSTLGVYPQFVAMSREI